MVIIYSSELGWICAIWQNVSLAVLNIYWKWSILYSFDLLQQKW